MKIDIFNHVFPKPLFERLERHLPAVLYQRYQAIATIHDPDARLRMLDEFDDVQQVLSLSQPPLEEIAGPHETPELARLGNDGMAERIWTATNRVTVRIRTAVGVNR